MLWGISTGAEAVIQGMDDTPSGKIISCEVPLAEMFGYATDLRSATQGRATYSMQFEKYNEVPANIAEAILKNLHNILNVTYKVLTHGQRKIFT